MPRHLQLTLLIAFLLPAFLVRAEDTSLTPDEYVKLGMPDADKEWTADNLANALKILTRVAAKKQLPRYKSGNSGAMFDRIVSTQNYSRFADGSIGTRINSAVRYNSTLNDIIKLYIEALGKGEVRDSELIELQITQLRLLAILRGLADEFAASLDKDDASYTAKMQGVAQIKSGFAVVLSGTLQMLGEGRAFRTEERLKLLNAQKDTFPKLIPALSPETRAKALEMVTQMQTDKAFADLQPSLKEFLGVVKEAAK